MTEILSKLIPIIFIILIGFLFRKKNLISQSTVNDMRYIVINLALPSVLFFSFLTAELKLQYGLLFLLIFLFCCLLFATGSVLTNAGVVKYKFSAGIFAGFEFGMLGVPFFSSIWGLDKLPVIALIGLGHEFFIWFVYVPLLQKKGSKKTTLKGTIISFIKSPIILLIMAGILFNITGAFKSFNNTIVGAGIVGTLDILSKITVPLILLIIGYTLRFSNLKLKLSVKYIVLRFIAVGIMGGFLYFLINTLIGFIDPVFKYAFVVFMLLPPPFILPLFVEDKEELEFFNNTLVLYVVASLTLLFIVSAFAVI